MAIGTTMAAVIGGGAALASGAMQSSAARSASRSQRDAAAQQVALQREIYEDQTQRFKPFLEGGNNALAAYMSEMGLGERPEGFAGLSMSPGARFAMEQGRDTMEAGAAAGGGLRSGATMGGLERMRFGMAAQDRDNQMNRLGGLVDMGQGSAGMQAQAGNAFAGMASNALANQGNAAAAGAIGSGNAWGNAFGNLAGVAGYMANNRNPTAPQGNNWWNR